MRSLEEHRQELIEKRLEISKALLYAPLNRPQPICFHFKEGAIMFRLTNLLLLVAFCSAITWGQGKGVDKSNERVRDSGSSRAPAINGGKTDIGAGRGMDFGKGKTPEVPPIPNPYRLPSRRDVILKAVEDVMRDRKLIVDEASSRPADGIIVSQPYTFVKGSLVSQSQLSRHAELATSGAGEWTRGRYTLTVEVQSIDGASANVAVNAKVEGRLETPTSVQWVTLPSLGLAEEDFLSALITAVTGTAPPGRTIQ